MIQYVQISDELMHRYVHAGQTHHLSALELLSLAVMLVDPEQVAELLAVKRAAEAARRTLENNTLERLAT